MTNSAMQRLSKPCVLLGCRIDPGSLPSRSSCKVHTKTGEFPRKDSLSSDLDPSSCCHAGRPHRSRGSVAGRHHLQMVQNLGRTRTQAEDRSFLLEAVATRTSLPQDSTIAWYRRHLMRHVRPNGLVLRLQTSHVHLKALLPAT